MWAQDKTYTGGTLRYHEIQGRKVAYHTKTQFLVQTAKGKKGAFKTSFTIIGDLPRAFFYFERINLGPGWKKRILMPDCSQHPVLIRQVFNGQA